MMPEHISPLFVVVSAIACVAHGMYALAPRYYHRVTISTPESVDSSRRVLLVRVYSLVHSSAIFCQVYYGKYCMHVIV